LKNNKVTSNFDLPEPFAPIKLLSTVMCRVADNVAMDEKIRNALVSDEFKAFFNAEAGTPDRFAVAYLNEKDRALYNCLNSTLWLSRRSLEEHKARHPEVTIENYREIPDIIRQGQVWAGHCAKRYLLLWIGGKPAIKTDAGGIDTWFLSLVVSGIG
jgi:hypothetical protein